LTGGELIDIGYRTFIVKNRIQGIFSPSNSIIRKFKSVADKEQMILNLTYGSETQSFIMMDSGHVIMTVLSVDEFLKRYSKTT